MDPLKNIRVAAPCPAGWDRMTGDDRVRHCAQCDLNVYNFAELTRAEILDLIARTEGRLCARLYRRADGTLLTKDCPTGLQRLQRRMSRAAAALTAALFSASAFLTGCASVGGKHPNTRLRVERSATQQPPVFAGVVVIENNPAPGVTVTLRDEATQREITTITNEYGAFSVALPAEGTYHVKLELIGLIPEVIERLVLKQNEVTRARVTMQLGPVEGVLLTAEVPVSKGKDILRTTYSQDFIDKLPH